MRFKLAENIGLKGEWILLRAIWDGCKYNYSQSLDGKTWNPYEENKRNIISITYISGPKDGTIED